MPPRTPEQKAERLRSKPTFLRASHELCRCVYAPGQGSSFEALGVPRYLPAKINCWNNLNLVGLAGLHHNVLEHLRLNNIRLTGETGDTPQIAVCADCLAGRRKICCLPLYFDRPEGTSSEEPLAKFGSGGPQPPAPPGPPLNWAAFRPEDFDHDALSASDEDAPGTAPAQTVDTSSVDYGHSPASAPTDISPHCSQDTEPSSQATEPDV